MYGFDIVSGAALMSYPGLHEQPVTSLVYLPQSDQLLTTSLETSAMVRAGGGGVG